MWVGEESGHPWTWMESSSAGHPGMVPRVAL